MPDAVIDISPIDGAGMGECKSDVPKDEFEEVKLEMIEEIETPDLVISLNHSCQWCDKYDETVKESMKNALLVIYLKVLYQMCMEVW